MKEGHAKSLAINIEIKSIKFGKATVEFELC